MQNRSCRVVWLTCQMQPKPGNSVDSPRSQMVAACPLVSAKFRKATSSLSQNIRHGNSGNCPPWLALWRADFLQHEASIRAFLAGHWLREERGKEVTKAWRKFHGNLWKQLRSSCWRDVFTDPGRLAIDSLMLFSTWARNASVIYSTLRETNKWIQMDTTKRFYVIN